MAASFTAAVHFSFSCSLLLLLACSSSPKAQARESQFFSKTSRSDTAQGATPAKGELPAPVKEEEPVQYKPDPTGNGFGLYGHGPEKLPPATTSSPSSYPTYNYNSAGENFNTENIPSEFNNEFNGVSYQNKEYFNAAGYPDSNKNSANTNKKPANYNAGNIPENGFSGGSYSYKYDSKEANARYPRNGNQPEAQLGMSDTRTLDNGRYFFDLNAEESYRKGRYVGPAAYRSFGGDESFANGGYTYGNNNYNNRGNGYEENNSMQGYYQNNEENNTQQNQEEYVP